MSPAVTPLKSARTQTLRRRCGTPWYCASCVFQATLHPANSSQRAPDFGHFPPSGKGTSGAFGSAILTISVRTAWKSFPWLELKAPGTFSQTIYRGRINSLALPSSASFFRISFTTLICSMNSPLRSPLNPALLPATLRSWLTG